MKHLGLLLDFIYPPSPEATGLRQLSPADVYEQIPRIRTVGGLIEPDIHAIWKYDDTLAQTVIYQLKNHHNLHAAECAGYAIYMYVQNVQQLRQMSLEKNLPLILIPIPLSPRRLRERGYNQSDLIAQAAAKFFKIKVASNILRRPKNSLEQKTKNRSERISSSKDIFVVTNPAQTAGMSCIVIDDVTTTGSTLAAARRTLLQAGARQVIPIALAH